jgi:hypothetical protein
MFETHKESYSIDGENHKLQLGQASPDELAAIIEQEEIEVAHIPQNDGKKPKTAFAYFLSENNDTARNFGRNFLSEMALLWKNLDPDSKKIFIEKSRIAKEQYQKNFSQNQENDHVVVKQRKANSNAVFPLKNLRTILAFDSETQKKMRPEAITYLNRAVDLFIDTIISETETGMRKSGKKKLTEQNIYNLVKKDIKYSFLQDLRIGNSNGVEVKGKINVEGLHSDRVFSQLKEELQNHQTAGNDLPEKKDDKKNTLFSYFKK